MKNKISTGSYHLILTETFQREKIRFDSVDDILLHHDGERHEYRLVMFLKSPAVYDVQEGFWNSVLFKIFQTYSKSFTYQKVLRSNGTEKNFKSAERKLRPDQYSGSF